MSRTRQATTTLLCPNIRLLQCTFLLYSDSGRKLTSCSILNCDPGTQIALSRWKYGRRMPDSLPGFARCHSGWKYHDQRIGSVGVILLSCRGVFSSSKVTLTHHESCEVLIVVLPGGGAKATPARRESARAGPSGVTDVRNLRRVHGQRD